MNKVVFFLACTIALSACTQHSKELKQTKFENDSLKLQIARNEVEMNEMLSALDAIETDLKSIREAEDFVNIEKDAELTVSKSEQIKSNMSLIIETLRKNKQQLSELQTKLNASGVHSAALQKTIDRISKDLSEKSELIVNLQKELVEKDKQLAQLNKHVEDMNTDLKILEGVNQSQTELINEQDQNMNTVFYCFGTKKELKEQNILTGGGLFTKAKTLAGDFNEDYFISIDKRQV
ncbi:MAG: hypothetical protein LBT42_08275, partial [Tannerella sp.]|nr:hypothetical protein [Tannerella sp.]